MDEYVLMDIKGSTNSLDPRSKVLVTLIMISGVAISLDYFQIFFYLVLYFPIVYLFKPRFVYLKRIVYPFILMTMFSIVLYFGLQSSEITLRVFSYSRTYSKLGFVLLIAYRYLVIILYDYMVLYSESSHTDIIEALASFKLGKRLIALLLLIQRISTRLTDDYQKMFIAAESKGAFSNSLVNKWTLINFQGIIKNTYVKLLILGRTIARAAQRSKTTGRSLTARGFHDTFQPTIRPWSSEGITISLLAFIFFVNITIVPWVR